MSTIPANAVVIPDGYLAVAITEDQADGVWRFCAAYRITRTDDGGADLAFADEADLEQITSPETPS